MPNERGDVIVCWGVDCVEIPAKPKTKHHEEDGDDLLPS
jgi:hypothetical protein